MHPFFRPRRARSSAPEATPYQRAGQIWDDRMGLSLAYAPELRLTHIIPETRLEPAYLRRLVRSIGASAARLDAAFHGPENLRVLSYPQLFARVVFHIARFGITGGLITSGWHLGYREQALREIRVRERQTM